MEQQNNEPLGVLWVKKKKDGNTFLTGVLKGKSGEIEIVAFKNKNKKNENSPDFYIWKSEPKEQKPKVENLEEDL